MPNLTFSIGPDRPPIIDLVVAVPEAPANSRMAAGRQVPLPHLVPALLDTGAMDSMIAKEIADSLELEVLGPRIVFGIGGLLSTHGHIRNVQLLFPGIPHILLRSSVPMIAIENLNHRGARVIIGRDVLSTCVLIYNGPHSSCTFAF